MGRNQLAGIIAAAGFGVLVIGYGVAFALTGDKVPGDTTVLGIPLGGLSENDAKAKLQAGAQGSAEPADQGQGRRFDVPGEAGRGRAQP